MGEGNYNKGVGEEIEETNCQAKTSSRTKKSGGEICEPNFRAKKMVGKKVWSKTNVGRGETEYRIF